MQSLAALQTLRPVQVPDATKRHKTLADARQSQQAEQFNDLKIKGAESDMAAQQAAMEKAAAVVSVFKKYGGDYSKARAEVYQLDPVLGSQMDKADAELRNTESQIKNREETLAATERKNAQDHVRELLQQGREANKPVILSPGSGALKPGEQQPFYTQPFKEEDKTLEERTADDWLSKNPGKTLSDYQDMDANRRRQVVNVNLERQREIELQNQTNAAPGQIVFSSTGRPVPSASVGDAAAKRMSDFQSAIGQADVVEGLLTKLGQTGAIKGYTLEHGVYWPVVQDGITAEQAEAVSEVQRLSNEYIKAVSGAAVSDQEMQRLARTTPSLRLTADANKKIVGHFRRYANSQLSNYLKLRGWKLKEADAAPESGAPADPMGIR